MAERYMKEDKPDTKSSESPETARKAGGKKVAEAEESRLESVHKTRKPVHYKRKDGSYGLEG